MSITTAHGCHQLNRLYTANRPRPHNQSVVMYGHLRGRYRAAYGTAEEARLLLLARAHVRELRRALLTFT